MPDRPSCAATRVRAGLVLASLIAAASVAAPSPSVLPSSATAATFAPSSASPAWQTSRSEAAFRAGIAAVERGDLGRAKEHFERALESSTRRREALLELASIARTERDTDALARAAVLYYESAVRRDGRVTAPPKKTFSLDGRDVSEAAARLAVLRVGAVNELASLAKERESKGGRTPEGLLTAAWARRFGQDLAQRSPEVYDALEPVLRPTVSLPKDAHGPVLKEIDRLGQRAMGSSQVGTAIRAGRILRGLGVQADFTHLRGPRPGGMAKWRAKGSGLLTRAREKLAEREEAPWTVEDLEWLASEEGEAFTRQHDDFAAPGVAVSPRGWYRIESDCGYGTLLAVASTIEQHHTRLVSLFGEDPFNGREPRQGLIRVVPDPSGLEAEGAPFFWAGGFQSGDNTVIRHSVGTIEGMGRTLTHELTHRFDGALHGGIPSWLAEGRAVWTGAAYGRIEDERFLDDWCSPGTMRKVAYQGLARPGPLEKLLSGTPEDYRQNYSVGNALYVFLMTWFPGEAPSMSDGEPVFRSRLIEFEDRGKHASTPSGRLEDFLDAFCDGKDGRPGSLEVFSAAFDEFLRGFDARRPKPWTKRYVSSYPRGGTSTWIYDEPTWTWDWVRAEPAFGQNQARVAGDFLRQEGSTTQAVRAYVWARAVDGSDVRTADGLLELFRAKKKLKGVSEEAAWVTSHERRGEPFASTLLPPGSVQAPPFPSSLPRCEALLAALVEARDEFAASGAASTALRLDADARRLGGWTGRAVAIGEAPGDMPLAALPADELLGWVDEELTRLDDKRPKELFLIEEEGGLLLGRREARSASGRFDRSGGGKSFVRASRWLLPGSYRVQTQVRFTTGYNTAVAVVGWTSRERNIRLQITAGDFEYAIGEADEEPKFDVVGWRFDGMRDRDGGLRGSLHGGAIELPSSSTSVTLELRVDGAVVSAWIAGQFAGSYHTIDGLPIEGHVGFGTISGAVHLEPPTVQRLDGEPAAVLDLVRGSGPRFRELLNTSVYFGPELQPASNGVLVLWIPSASKADVVVREGVANRDSEAATAAAVGRAKRSAKELLRRMARNDVVQPFVLVLPERFRSVVDREELLGVLAEAAPESAPAPRLVFHRVVPTSGPELAPSDRGAGSGERPGSSAASDPVTGQSALDGGRRWLIFVDSASVARAVRAWTGSTAVDDDGIEHWLTVFRDHGRPERVLPEVKRPAPEDDADDDSGDD